MFGHRNRCSDSCDCGDRALTRLRSNDPTCHLPRLQELQRVTASSGGCGTRTWEGLQPIARCLAAEALTQKRCRRRATVSAGTGRRRLPACRCPHPDSDPNADPKLSPSPSSHADATPKPPDSIPKFMPLTLMPSSCKLAAILPALLSTRMHQACESSCARARQGRSCKASQARMARHTVQARRVCSTKARYPSCLAASRRVDHPDTLLVAQADWSPGGCTTP